MTSFATLFTLETQRLFRRPLAWLVLCLGSALMALFYMLLMVRYLDHESELRAAGVTAELMVRYFGSAALIALLLTPLITMQAVADDKRDGMLRFLFSTPASSAHIVLAKLAAVLCLVGSWWAVIALMPLTLLWGAAIDVGVYATNLLGLALFMLLHACLGVMCSSLTRQPVAAAVLALVVSLSLWLAEYAQRLDRESNLLGGISTLTRMRGFALGVLNLADIVYFSALALCCATIAVWAVEGTRRYA
jgi:ABC-2 type transport system permease protein